MKIGVIRGDGTGPEVVAEGLKVLDAVKGDAAFELVEFDLGAERYLRTGDVLPDEELDRLREMDAVFLGAVGDPRVKPGHPRARPAAEGPVRAGSVREPAAGGALPRGRDPRAQPQRGRRELRRRARELRRPLHGRGRVPPQGHAVRGRGAGIDQHAARRGAHRALRVRPRDAARPPPEAHPGAQDERADVRRRPVPAGRRRGEWRVPRRRDRLRARRRRVHLLPGLARAVRRDRHRQHVRRHHHRPRRHDPGRHGHRRRRQHQPRRRQHVRTDRRHRARPHRQGHDQPARGDRRGRDAAAGNSAQDEAAARIDRGIRAATRSR